MTVATVPLVLDCYDGSMAPLVQGRALLVPSVRLEDAADQVTLMPVPLRVVFNEDSELPTVDLVPTDNTSFLPLGWAWSITFAGMSNPPDPFTFDLPYNGGVTQYLSEVAVVEAATEFQSYMPLTGGALLGELTPSVVTLEDAATVAVNAVLGNDFQLLMTAAVGSSRVVAAPTGGKNGQKILFDLQQPPSGGPCGITWAAGYEFGAAGEPDLSVGTSQNDLWAFRYKASKSAWQFLGPASGFA